MLKWQRKVKSNERCTIVEAIRRQDIDNNVNAAKVDNDETDADMTTCSKKQRKKHN
jgi:hypothetical protein